MLRRSPALIEVSELGTTRPHRGRTEIPIDELERGSLGVDPSDEEGVVW